MNEFLEVVAQLYKRVCSIVGPTVFLLVYPMSIHYAISKTNDNANSDGEEHNSYTNYRVPIPPTHC